MCLYFHLTVLITFIRFVTSCDVGYVYVNYQCVIAKRLNDFCHVDQECRYYDYNTVCEDSICLCRSEFKYNSLLRKCIIRGIIFTNKIGFDEHYISRLNNSLIPVFKSRDIDEFAENQTSLYNSCPYGYMDQLTQKCQNKLIELNVETLLFLFSLIIIFSVILVIVFSQKGSNFTQTDALNNGISYQDLMALQTFESRSDETDLKETNFSYPPSYQEVQNKETIVTINDDLPTYEDAINLPKLIK